MSLGKRKFDYIDALNSLRPNSSWSFIGDDYEGLSWLEDTDPPTEEELKDEAKRLQDEWDLLEYQRLRETEYPDYRKYLDAVIKDDKAQLDEYIKECNDVKKKYPKPTS